MKSSLLILLLLLTASPLFAYTAFDMRENCRAIVESSEDRQLEDGSREIFLPLTFKVGACWGGFSAIQSGVRIKFKQDEWPALLICVPPEVTRRQLIEVFFLYASNNPLKGHDDWFFVAWEALMQEFPC
jgi:hypothetical protein